MHSDLMLTEEEGDYYYEDNFSVPFEETFQYRKVVGSDLHSSSSPTSAQLPTNHLHHLHHQHHHHYPPPPPPQPPHHHHHHNHHVIDFHNNAYYESYSLPYSSLASSAISTSDGGAFGHDDDDDPLPPPPPMFPPSSSSIAASSAAAATGTGPPPAIPPVATNEEYDDVEEEDEDDDVLNSKHVLFTSQLSQDYEKAYREECSQKGLLLSQYEDVRVVEPSVNYHQLAFTDDLLLMDDESMSQSRAIAMGLQSSSSSFLFKLDEREGEEGGGGGRRVGAFRNNSGRGTGKGVGGGGGGGRIVPSTSNSSFSPSSRLATWSQLKEAANSPSHQSWRQLRQLVLNQGPTTPPLPSTPSSIQPSSPPSSTVPPTAAAAASSSSSTAAVVVPSTSSSTAVRRRGNASNIRERREACISTTVLELYQRRGQLLDDVIPEDECVPSPTLPNPSSLSSPLPTPTTLISQQLPHEQQPPPHHLPPPPPPPPLSQNLFSSSSPPPPPPHATSAAVVPPPLPVVSIPVSYSSSSSSSSFNSNKRDLAHFQHLFSMKDFPSNAPPGHHYPHPHHNYHHLSSTNTNLLTRGTSEIHLPSRVRAGSSPPLPGTSSDPSHPTTVTSPTSIPLGPPGPPLQAHYFLGRSPSEEDMSRLSQLFIGPTVRRSQENLTRNNLSNRKSPPTSAANNNETTTTTTGGSGGSSGSVAAAAGVRRRETPCLLGSTCRRTNKNRVSRPRSSHFVTVPCRTRMTLNLVSPLPDLSFLNPSTPTPTSIVANLTTANGGTAATTTTTTGIALTSTNTATTTTTIEKPRLRNTTTIINRNTMGGTDIGKPPPPPHSRRNESVGGGGAPGGAAIPHQPLSGDSGFDSSPVEMATTTESSSAVVVGSRHPLLGRGMCSQCLAILQRDVDLIHLQKHLSEPDIAQKIRRHDDHVVGSNRVSSLATVHHLTGETTTTTTGTIITKNSTNNNQNVHPSAVSNNQASGNKIIHSPSPVRKFASEAYLESHGRTDEARRLTKNPVGHHLHGHGIDPTVTSTSESSSLFFNSTGTEEIGYYSSSISNQSMPSFDNTTACGNNNITTANGGGIVGNNNGKLSSHIMCAQQHANTTKKSVSFSEKILLHPITGAGSGGTTATGGTSTTTTTTEAAVATTLSDGSVAGIVTVNAIGLTNTAPATPTGINSLLDTHEHAEHKVIPRDYGVYGDDPLLAEFNFSSSTESPNSHNHHHNHHHHGNSSTNTNLTAAAKNKLAIRNERYQRVITEVVQSVKDVMSQHTSGPQHVNNNHLYATAIERFVSSMWSLLSDGMIPPTGARLLFSSASKQKPKVWTLVEESGRAGVCPRSLSGVMSTARSAGASLPDRARFHAFICACLNAKSLQSWLEFLVRHANLMKKFYHEDAFLMQSRQSHSVAAELYADLLTNLEVLLHLPTALPLIHTNVPLHNEQQQQQQQRPSVSSTVSSSSVGRNSTDSNTNTINNNNNNKSSSNVNNNRKTTNTSHTVTSQPIRGRHDVINNQSKSRSLRTLPSNINNNNSNNNIATATANHPHTTTATTVNSNANENNTTFLNSAFAAVKRKTTNVTTTTTTDDKTN